MLNSLIIAVVLGQSIEVARQGFQEPPPREYFEHSLIHLRIATDDLPETTEVHAVWNIVDRERLDSSLPIDRDAKHPLDIYVVGPPGKDYTIFANVFFRVPGAEEWSTRLKDIRFSIVPRGPPTPGPGPGPKPPPNPTVAPFQTPGFSVLILREASGTGLPANQQSIFNSPRILKTAGRCVTIPGGTDKFFRVWDDDYSDDDLADVPQALRDAYRSVLRQANGKLPWIAIATATGGHSGPLPGTVDETLSLLEQYQK